MTVTPEARRWAPFSDRLNGIGWNWLINNPIGENATDSYQSTMFES